MNKIMKRQVILLVILQANSLALGDGFDAALREGYAHINGYLQTPTGGTPGTSDKKRPTFRELGVDDTTYTDVDLRYKMDPYAVYASARFTHIDSSGVLQKDLTTQGQNFMKGESYRHDTTFNIYHFGVQDDFGYLTGKIELALMDFNYKLRTAEASAERSYTKPGVRLGAEKSFKFDKLDIVVEASGSIPLPNTPYIYSVGAMVKYWLAESLNIGVGVEYFYLDYKDNQNLQNHLRLEMQPALSVSVQYMF
jgi:hypothetical protein